MKIQAVFPLGLSLLVSALAVLILNADLTARGVGYDLGKGLSGTLVIGVVAMLLGAIGFGATMVAEGWSEKGPILAFGLAAFFGLMGFNAVMMAMGLHLPPIVPAVLEERFLWLVLAVSIAQVFCSAWLAKYWN